ncbi:MAG: NUDIX hydrolase [Anaerolineales bacterium]|nr:NUDIX hydrolase [Anaerolineales bacterium]
MNPERLSRNVIYQSPWVNLYLDKVKFPNGLVIDEFHLLDFPRAAVTAIVEDDAENIVLARIPRYASGTTEWELPAGGVEIGESEIDAAKREALEETGYTSDNHALIYSYYPMNGSANKIFHVVHCRAIEQVQDFDQNEVSETRWFTKDEIRQMIKDKAITDGFTLTALLLWLQN